MSDMDNDKQKNGFMVFIIVIMIAVVAAVVSIIVINKTSSKSKSDKSDRIERREQNKPAPRKSSDGIVIKAADAFPKLFSRSKKKKTGYIAALHIEGIITDDDGSTYNQEWLLDTIDELKDDEYNKAIILFVDSPGGTVYESDEAYLALMDYKKETGKPIYAYMAHIAASGGYYISCAADKIYANRNTTTGSIGVMNGTSFDLTKLFETLGIKPDTFTAGRNKNMRNFDSPITDEQREIIQADLNEAYEQFTEIVAESRGLKIARVRELADGRTYTARQAVEHGLIDSISTWDETVAAMNEMLEADYEAIDFEYERESSVFDYLPGFMAKAFQKSNSKNVLERVASVIDSMYPQIKYPAYIYLGN